MADRCPTIRGLCRLRITRLDDLGNVAAGPNNSWVSSGFLELGFSPVIEEGERFTLKNGCGGILADFEDEDRRIGYTLSLADGLYEAGLKEMLLGDAVILDGSDVVGTAAADQTDEDFVPSRVALEAWAKAIDGDAQDAVRPWVYFLWPSTSWVEADTTIGSDFWQPAFSGKSRSNALWGNGPYGDLGIADDQLSPIFNTILIDQDPPASACGYATVTPGS